MTELLPDQNRQTATAPVEAPDIRSSQVPARQTLVDGVLRLFPGIQLDSPIDDKQAKNRQGKAFGRQFRSEGIGVGFDLAHLLLMAFYGPGEAAMMLARADKGEFVFGAKSRYEGGGYRYSVQVDVVKDASRESGYVVQFASLRQGRGNK